MNDDPRPTGDPDTDESSTNAAAEVRRLWLQIGWMMLPGFLSAMVIVALLVAEGGLALLAPTGWDPLGLDTAIAGIGITLFLGSELSRIPTYQQNPHGAARAEVLSMVTFAATQLGSVLAWLTVPLLKSSLVGALAGCGTGILMSVLSGLVRPSSDELRTAQARHQLTKIRAAVVVLVRTTAGRPRSSCTRRQAYIVIGSIGGVFAIWPAAIPATMAITSWTLFSEDPVKPLLAWLGVGAFGSLSFLWLVGAQLEWRLNRDSGGSFLSRFVELGLLSGAIVLTFTVAVITVALRGLGPFLVGLMTFGSPLVAALLLGRSRPTDALLRHRLLVRAYALQRQTR